MKINPSLLLLLFCFLSFNTNAQEDFVWARSAEGNLAEHVSRVSTDIHGNVIIIGWFTTATVTFGSTTLTNRFSGLHDLFLVKYDALGHVLWAKSAGGGNMDIGNGVCTDASGNVIITGWFKSYSITFDSQTLINTGDDDMFVVKYDPSGNLLWAQNAGGTSYECAYSVSTDTHDNILVTGFFNSPILTFGSTKLTNTGNTNTHDMFVVKYDALGNVIWAKSAGGNDSELGYSVSTDTEDNVIVTGWYDSPSITIGSTSLSNQGIGGDVFLAKYDASGNSLWAKSLGGNDDDASWKISIDSKGSIYVIGTFNSRELMVDSIKLTSGTFDVFLAKYSSSGTVHWAKNLGGTGDKEGNGIAIDDHDNFFITGNFSAPTLTFGSTVLTNTGMYDMFLAKYDTQGNVIWAKNAEGSNIEHGMDVATHGSAVFVTGYSVTPFLYFGPFSFVNFSGRFDMFLVKLDVLTGIAESSNTSLPGIFPNPATSQITINVNADLIGSYYTLYNYTGQEIRTGKLYSENTILDWSNLSVGMYFIRFSENKKQTLKVIKE